MTMSGLKITCRVIRRSVSVAIAWQYSNMLPASASAHLRVGLDARGRHGPRQGLVRRHPSDADAVQVN